MKLDSIHAKSLHPIFTLKDTLNSISFETKSGPNTIIITMNLIYW